MEILAPEIVIRPFEPTDADYDALAAVHNALYPDQPETGAEIRERDERLDHDRYTRRRFVAAVAQTGVVCGTGIYSHSPASYDPARYDFWVAVPPDYQGRGIGRRLYDELLGELQTRGARELVSYARETMPHAVAFLERRGFREALRSWESVLDVAAFDSAPFAPYEDRVRAQGVEITTLAQERERNPRWLEACHALDTGLWVDLPSPTPLTPLSLEEYRTHIVESRRFIPEAYFLARAGDEYVGVSFLERNAAQPDTLSQGFTGVRKDYRGRGVAMALKLATIRYACAHDIRFIRTDNATVNTAMLAVNEKLGFQRRPAWIEFLKRLDGDAPPEA